MTLDPRDATRAARPRLLPPFGYLTRLGLVGALCLVLTACGTSAAPGGRGLATDGSPGAGPVPTGSTPTPVSKPAGTDAGGGNGAGSSSGTGSGSGTGSAATPAATGSGAVKSSPFAIQMTGADGQPSVGTTVADPNAAPAPVAFADATQPMGSPAETLAYAPFGWIVGTRTRAELLASPFQGNQLLWNEQGTFFSVTGVSAVKTYADRTEYSLSHNAGPAFGPALLVVKKSADGTLSLDLTPPSGLPQVISTVFSLTSPTTEGLYGLGARKDAFDQRGSYRNVWTEQQDTGPGQLSAATNPTLGESYAFPNGPQSAYHVEAALFGGRGWGAWIDQTEVSRLDLAVGRADTVRWHVAAPHLTLHLNANGLEGASKAFTSAHGRAPAPPAWVYKPWADVINQGEGEAAPNGQGFTGGARVKADAQAILAMAAQTGIPFGVIGLEGWQSVPDIAGFVADAKKQGYHVSGYWNMFTSETATPDSAERDAAYSTAKAAGLFVKDPTGADYHVVTNRQGLSYIIDYTSKGATAYWAGQLNRMFSLGIEGFMHDFGELTVTGMTYADGRPQEQVHNDYPRLYHAAARAAIDAYKAAHPDFQPFYYFRSGYTGQCQYTGGIFPGDESTDFNPTNGLPGVIPAMLNASLTGCNMFTTDVGGYLDLITPRTSKELFIRWSQLAAFTPILRVHNSTYNKSVYPWSFDDQTLDVFRRYARAKVMLAPTVDALAQRAAADGTIGPVRALALDDPSQAARGVKDEWRLGLDLLVAPVTAQGATARSVYFPTGAHWRRVMVAGDGSFTATDQVFVGGTSATVPVTLDDIPLFRREA